MCGRTAGHMDSVLFCFCTDGFLSGSSIILKQVETTHAHAATPPPLLTLGLFATPYLDVAY
jgi:hypothetical protein